MADVEAPPPSVDAQDPLPEGSWFFRRVFTFITTTVIIIGIAVMVHTMTELAKGEPELIVGAFVKIIGWLLLYAWFNMTYYVVAPSAEHVTRMWQAATMFKRGVTSSLTQRAVGPDGSSATSQTKVGVGVVPTPDISSLQGGSSQTGSPDNTGNDLPWRKDG